MMRAAILSVVTLAHAVFCLSLLLVRPDSGAGVLAITARRQFDEWTPLLDLYRSAPNLTSATVALIRPKALELSWCAAPLPRGTSRAPYCACLEAQKGDYASSSGSVMPGLVSCLGARPVWRVWPVWGVQFRTPAVYILYVSACLLWVAVGLDHYWTRIPMWTFSAVVSVALVAADPLHNALWAIAAVFVAALIEWIVIPGIVPPSYALVPPAGDGDAQQEQQPQQVAPAEGAADEPQLGGLLVDRLSTCFWWCEFLCAPNFAIYVCLMHSGRDVFFVLVVILLGSTVGGLGLRLYWSGSEGGSASKAQFGDTMQRIAWLGVLASSFALLSLAGIYYRDTDLFVMDAGSVNLLSMTILIGLLQWPGARDSSVTFWLQGGTALARNVVLFALVAFDLDRK